MKKKSLWSVGVLSLAVILFVLGSSLAGAHSQKPHVNLTLNGVKVSDPYSHLEGKNVYVSVSTFSKYYGAKWTFNKKNNSVYLNGKKVSNEYGKPTKIEGTMTASVQALAEALGDANAKKVGHYETGYDAKTRTENVTILPKGFISPDNHSVVPNMGSHWVDPRNPATGPIWGTYKGKLVFFEVMPDNNLVHDLTLKGTQGIPYPHYIDHVTINWEPQGHPGDTNPHHDVHMYFISEQEQAGIK